MKRVFIAIDISDEAREQAARYTDRLKAASAGARLSWTRPENMHLTMRFLGNVDDAGLDAATKATRHASKQVRPFRLKISGTGVFPSAKAARVIWLGIEDPDRGAGTAYRVLEEELVRAGFESENRGFKPHLTLARIKDARSSSDLVKSHLAAAFEAPEFEINEFVIYESRLSPGGSVYTVLSKHSFAG